MKFNWVFYRDFTLWVEKQMVKRARAAADEQGWLLFAIFVRECGNAFRLFVSPWEGVSALFKGNLLQIIKGVVAYVAINPDPLKPAREAIEGLYVKYGDRPATSPTA